MKYFISAIILISVSFYFGYDYGITKGKVDIANIFNAEKEAIISDFEKTLLAERTRYEEVTKALRERSTYISELNNRANNLRVQFNKLQSECYISTEKDNNRPNAQQGTNSQRTIPLAKILERATSLIKERDQIAIEYNELLKQCK